MILSVGMSGYYSLLAFCHVSGMTSTKLWFNVNATPDFPSDFPKTWFDRTDRLYLEASTAKAGCTVPKAGVGADTM